MKVLPLELLDDRQDAALRREGYKTFRGWLDAGFVVVKGEKAKARTSKGTAMFHQSQVTLIGSDEPYEDEDPWLSEHDFLNG